MGLDAPNQPTPPDSHIIQAGTYYDLRMVGSTTLIILPSLRGLQWMLERHWHMEVRSPKAFSDMLWGFLQLEHVWLMTASEKADLGLLTVSDVIKLGAYHDNQCYLLPGENGLTAFQKLSRDWILECPNVTPDPKENDNAG